MDNFVDMRKASKINWRTQQVNDNGYPGDTNLQLGCLMRIADAAESMAKNHIQLQSDLDWYKKRYEESNRDINRLKRSNNALRGHIKRMKRKLNS